MRQRRQSKSTQSSPEVEQEPPRIDTPRPTARRLRLPTHDLIAGISVALVLIPQALAYAQLAGMPGYTGLYAAVLPPIIAALFASSPHLQTGPVAVTALLTFGALTALAEPGSAEYVKLAALLALVVGVARVLVGILRAGVLAYLMSQTVLIGFMPAAAILIIATQLPSALGSDPSVDGILPRAAWSVVHPGSWSPTAIGLAALTVLLMVGGRRLHRFFPGVLLAVGAGLGYSLVADYEGSTVGEIPAELPPLSLDLPWEQLPTLAVGGIVIALVGFAEPAAIARTFAALERGRWDPNREFVSQGMANLAAGVSGAFPVGGSFSRSALNRMAGGRTRWSGAVTGLAVLAFLPFASLLESLPIAILGAIVIVAVAGLVQLGPMVEVLRYSWPQSVIMLTTFALTLLLAPHVERALLAGVGLAILIHLKRELRLDLTATVVGDALHLRPKGVLWFGTARSLEDRFLDLLAEHPEARRLVLHLDGLGRIDLSGALVLRTLVDDARGQLIVTVEGVPPHARPLMRRVLPDASSKDDGEASAARS